MQTVSGGFFMSNHPNYRKTLIACYLGYITQAICANFIPLLFLTFRSSFGISLELIALIPTIFFFVQLLVDLAAAKFVDRIGYRVCVVAAEVFAAAGLISLAVLPDLFPNPFIGVLLSVVIYAIGSGLLEVLVSPIVEACPFENKDGVMSTLHSFYCWGVVLVILGSTVFFALFGVENWRILACIWALIPLFDIYNFATCPIAPLMEEGESSMPVSQLLRTPIFWLLAFLMVCSGASELALGQWASAFTESSLKVTKSVGDLAGPCLFAVLQGISRAFYGKYSEKISLTKFMMGCGALCVFCYLLASLTTSPVLGLLGCALCGLSVGIMWPGTFSLSAQKCRAGGTAMFAFLALAGDLGGSLGPSVIGAFSGLAGDNLKIGVLAATIFPIGLIIGLIILGRRKAAK